MDPDDLPDEERTRDSQSPEAARVDWDGIKHAYVKGDRSLQRIADAFGKNRTAISARAKKDGWVREVGTKPLPPGRKPRPPGAAPAKRSTPQQVRARRIMARLFTVLDEKMKTLEEGIARAKEAGTPPSSAADAERDARTLNGLARLYAKLVELDARSREQEPKGSTTEAEPKEGEPDADRLRRDLALRLQQLNRDRDA
jgi:hypothetical protein